MSRTENDEALQNELEQLQKDYATLLGQAKLVIADTKALRAERDQLRIALQDLMTIARTFRKVPNKDHHWGDLDDAAMAQAEAALNQGRKTCSCGTAFADEPGHESHASDCASRQHTASECTCGLADRLAAQKD